jgi:hypothetical protein
MNPTQTQAVITRKINLPKKTIQDVAQRDDAVQKLQRQKAARPDNKLAAKVKALQAEVEVLKKAQSGRQDLNEIKYQRTQAEKAKVEAARALAQAAQLAAALMKLRLSDKAVEKIASGAQLEAADLPQVSLLPAGTAYAGEPPMGPDPKFVVLLSKPSGAV